MTGPLALSANGFGPDVAIDEEGTTHVAWQEPRAAGRDVIRYCRVQRPGSSCADPQTFTPSGPVYQRASNLNAVWVFAPRLDRVIILAQREITGIDEVKVDPETARPGCRAGGGCVGASYPVYAFVSEDGGVTFGERIIADLPLLDAAVITLGAGTPEERDRIALSYGTEVQFADLDHVDVARNGVQAAPPTADLDRDTPRGGDSTTVFEGNGQAVGALGDRPVAVLAGSPADEILPGATNLLRRYPRSGGSEKDFAVTGSWSPWEPAGRGSLPRLASTPRGLFLMNRYKTGWEVRDVTRVRRPGRPAVLGRESVSYAGTAGDLEGDGSGRVSAAWIGATRFTGDGTSNSALRRYALRLATSANGRAFGAPQNLVEFGNPRGGSIADVFRLRLAGLDDGGGAVVLERGRFFDTNAPHAISLVLFGSRVARPVDDVHISGAEVTQGVQDPNPLVRSRTRPNDAVFYASGSATLGHAKTTAVRVYATTRRALAGPPPDMVLRVRLGTRLIETLRATPPPAMPGLPVGDAFTVTPAIHAGVNQVYTFEVPPLGSPGFYTLEAQINPAGAVPGVTECARCRGPDNVLRVSNLIVFRTTIVRVLPLQMFVRGANGTPPPAPDVFATSQSILPLELSVPPYRAAIDMTLAAHLPTDTLFGMGTPDGRQGIGIDAVEDWADDNNDISSYFPIGIYPFDGRSFGFPVPGVRASDGYWMRGGQNFNGEFLGDVRCSVSDCDKSLYGDRQPVAVLGDNPARDVIETSHEIIHGLGIKHAGTNRGCYTEKNQVGEDWPFGDDGRTDGLGLDMRPTGNVGFVRGNPPPFRRVPANVPGAPPIRWDLMSYCGPSSARWFSLYQWNRVARFKAPGQAASAVARSAAAGRSLRVTAIFNADGRGAISDVVPDDGAPLSADRPGVPQDLVAIAKDAAGQTIFRGAIEADVSGETGTQFARLRAQVPLTARSVEIVRNGTVLTSRTASRRAPTVRIVAPLRGATLGRTANVEVRWRAADADGDQLEAHVDYAMDGRRYATVGITDADRMTLPARLFTRSSAARVRIRVRDGFHETTATVGPLRSLGAPPDITIRSPIAGEHPKAGASVVLEAIAYDDAGRRLSDRALRWRQGGRTLLARGTGSAVLGAGTTRLTVEARDRSGRVGRRTVVVRPTGSKPRFSRLTGPARVALRARSVVLRVASTFPATFRIGGRNHAVGPRVRSIAVRLPRSGRQIRLAATLRSGSVVTTAAVTVVRR